MKALIVGLNVSLWLILDVTQSAPVAFTERSGVVKAIRVKRIVMPFVPQI